MKLLTQCNQEIIPARDLCICDMLELGRLRKVGEADHLLAGDGDILYYDYLTLAEEEVIYGSNG